MNRSIRRVALGVALVFLALFVNLNYVQLGRSDDLSAHPDNRRQIVEEYSIRRGEIYANDGKTLLAESVDTDDPTYRFRRRYPQGRLYGNITGYYSFTFGATGVERSYNDWMIGEKPDTPTSFVDDLLGRRRAGNVIQLSIDPDLQKLAKRAMRGQRGAVAVMDVETGAVRALWSYGMYDPNGVSLGPGHEEEAADAFDELRRDPLRPLTFKATQERYPPGSTFKIVGAAAALEAGITPKTTFPDPRRLDLPDTNLNLRNFQGGSCAGGRISLERGFFVSCNTTFAQVAMCVTFRIRCPSSKVKRLPLYEMALRFGLDRDPALDIATAPSCVRSIAGAGCDDPAGLSRPAIAYSGIGQQDVRLTVLQMARISATVSNGGTVPKPYLVEKVLDPSGKIISETEPSLSRPIYSKRTARLLRQLMVGVVRQGTGRCVAFRDASKGTIGGKTGTAQTGRKGEPPHVWFTAFSKKLAVAVVVENGGDLRRDATGGKVAGPIARSMIEGRLAPRTC